MPLANVPPTASVTAAVAKRVANKTAAAAPKIRNDGRLHERFVATLFQFTFYKIQSRHVLPINISNKIL